jgi:hypothetical protein
MEVVRPDVDAFLFDWVSRAPFRRDWFFEERNGNCRLMAEFTVTLSETAARWRRAIAPTVEWFARALWEESPKMAGYRVPANRLTPKPQARGARRRTSHHIEGSDGSTEFVPDLWRADHAQGNLLSDLQCRSLKGAFRESL